jgi:hypothetical protein
MTSMGLGSIRTCNILTLLLRVVPRRKQLEGPTYAPSQVLRWAQVPFENREGFAKLSAGYRIEWNDLVPETVEVSKREMEGRKLLCKWNARVWVTCYHRAKLTLSKLDLDPSWLC